MYAVDVLNVTVYGRKLLQRVIIHVFLTLKLRTNYSQMDYNKNPL